MKELEDKNIKIKSLVEQAQSYFSYTLSLPERSIRSLAALLGGSIHLLSQTVFPGALRNSTSYHFTLGLFQSFLTTRIAGMQEQTGSAQLEDNYIQRKLIGTSFEAAGLLTMRLSPIWLFAIASDAAGGSKVFLNRLVESLRENNVIEPSTEANDLVDVLEAIQTASRKTAKVADTPPLTREELSALADDMRGSYSEIFSSASNLIPNFNNLWNTMKQVSKKENISFEKLSGIMTISAANIAKNSVGTASALGKTGFNLFDEVILDSYKTTLDQISKQGVDHYLQSHLQPFLKSAQAHFDPKQKTWVQSVLTKIKLNLFKNTGN